MALRSTRVDPIRNFKFQVNVDGFTSAGFSECSPLKKTHDVVEYREGTDPITPRKLPGLSKFENVTLKKGVTKSLDFYQWVKDVTDIVKSGNLGPDGVPEADMRRGVEIVVADFNSTFRRVDQLFNAWPASYEKSQLQGTGNEVYMESLELTCEGWDSKTI